MHVHSFLLTSGLLSNACCCDIKIFRFYDIELLILERNTLVNVYMIVIRSVVNSFWYVNRINDLL